MVTRKCTGLHLKTGAAPLLSSSGGGFVREVGGFAFHHYKALVKEADAEEFWKITPAWMTFGELPANGV